MAKLSELHGDGPFGFSAGGEELVVVRTPSGLRAYEGRCPHQGALLGEGELVAGELVCRNHGWRFDAASGERRDGPGCLRAVPLEVRGEALVALPAALAPAAGGRRLRTVRDLSGPRRLPLLGNLLDTQLERLHLQLESWAGEFGAAYRFDLGPSSWIVISDPALAQEALRERPAGFRRFGTLERVFNELQLEGVFSAEGASWRPLRRLSMEALAQQHLRSFYPALREVALGLHQRWAKRAGAQIDLRDDFKRFTTDLIVRLAFGAESDTLESNGGELHEHLSLILPNLNRRSFAAVPLWRLIKLPQERRFERSVRWLLDFVRGLVDRTREKLERRPELRAQPENFLQAMVAARDENGQPFATGQILGNALQMLVAGEDTTAQTLAWAAHELCDDPTSFAALQAEADARFGDALAPPDFACASELPWASAVAQETLRLRPVAPLIILDAERDTTLGDLSLPAGSRLCLLLRQGALSEQRFAEPRTFRPARWLGGASDRGPHDPAAVLPFGSGPRLCPGRMLALLEMRVALSTLARSFDLRRAGERAAVQERFEFVMAPHGLRVHLEPRQRVEQRPQQACPAG